MSRNTMYALLAMLGIAAGTLVWRQWSYKRATGTQQALTRILEQTDENPGERIRLLDSIMAAHPDDATIRRVAVYQKLRAHVELRSDSATVVRAVSDFLSTDTSGAAFNFASSVYADLAINAPEGLRYAHRALAEVREVKRPKDMTEVQWAQQRRMMVGECHHILGRLYALSGQSRPALAALRAAADSVPDSPVILLRMAEIHERMGQLDSALESYMQALRLSHADTSALAGFARLYPAVHGPAVDPATVLDTLVAHARAKRRADLLAQRISQPAAPFDLSTLAGRQYRLSDFRGKTLVLYFWATWCGPCKRQLPAIQEAHIRLKAHKDIELLTVSFDQHFEVVPPFLARKRYDFPVVPGDEGLYKSYLLEGLPTCAVVDSTGTIRFKRLGNSDAGDFLEELGWQLEAVSGKAPW